MLLKIPLSTLPLHVLWIDLVVSQERQSLWLPKDDLKDPSTWSSPPLVLFHDIHDGLLAKYDYKDRVSPPAQPGVRTRPPCDSDESSLSQQETSPLFLP